MSRREKGMRGNEQAGEGNEGGMSRREKGMRGNEGE